MAPTDEAFLKQVQGAMDAGATGLAVGRNAWQNANPLQMAAELRKVIHERQRSEKLVPTSGSQAP